MVVKTFRGLLADGGQDRIALSTIKGKVGYRIAKFDIFQAEPGDQEVELTLKIFKEQQTTINNTVNFTDSSLLGVAYWSRGTSGNYPLTQAVTFDTEIFNQDIFITCDDTSGNSLPGNYYIVLEVVPLDDAGAEYTTLKDMRAE